MAIAEGWIKGEKVAETLDRLLTDPLGTLRLYTEYVLSEDLKAVTGGPILRTILSSLSDSDSGHSISELAKKTGIPMHTISRYIPSLLTADLIAQTEGTIKIRDRVILEYLKLEA
jgi:response regulator of citrate/malate metabolism